MTRARMLPLLLALPLVALSACGDDNKIDGSDAPVDVAGRSYAATAAAGFALPAASNLVISFEADRLGVTGGCNMIGGGYTIASNVLTAEGGFIQTEMACDEPLMQLDTDVVALLSSSPTLSANGDVLTITGTATSLTLRLQQPPADMPLEGTLWTVTSLVKNDAVTGGFAVEPTITFQDGQALVFSGCNNGFAGVAVTDDVITFEPLGLTKMACADDIMTVESAVVATLQGDVEYTIKGNTLELTGADGGLLLTGATPG